jgi:hypothetical protein
MAERKREANNETLANFIMSHLVLFFAGNNLPTK